MAERRRDDDTNVARSAAAIAGRLTDRLGPTTRSIQQILVAEIAELADDPQLLELQRDTVEANIETVFSAIRHRIPIEHVEPPTEALEYARRLAQRDVSINALVRAYRLGHREVLNSVLDEIRASTLNPQRALDVYEHIAAISFGYIDWISQQVVVAYQSERDRWLESRNNLRAHRVREILDGADIDVDAVSTAIHYPLKRIHLAVIAWYRDTDHSDELAAMEQFTKQLAQSIGACDSPLFVCVDRLTGWAWIPLPDAAASDAAARVRSFSGSRKEAPWITAGSPLPGIEGFRRSHQQAQLARAVAIASGATAHRVTAISDPGLSVAGLLGDNLPAASAWIAEVLGPLACHTDSDARLRETLQAFLGAGSSFKGAADKLHLHPNSVKYRVQRAVERRGRPISDDRLDVEVALLLCHWFGTAVLPRETQ